MTSQSAAPRQNSVASRHAILDICLFAALVLFGVQLRIILQHLPNFAPVAALALFSGYFFRSWLVALLVPLSVMAISDCFIGGYDWQMMAIVYAMLAAPVALRNVLRTYLRIEKGSVFAMLRPIAGLVACGVGSSIVFFLITNLGSFLWFDMYEGSFSGLVHCYVQALPFFRATLTGDLFFAIVLFGGYALAVHAQLVTLPQPAKASVSVA